MCMMKTLCVASLTRRKTRPTVTVDRPAPHRLFVIQLLAEVTTTQSTLLTCSERVRRSTPAPAPMSIHFSRRMSLSHRENTSPYLTCLCAATTGRILSVTGVSLDSFHGVLSFHRDSADPITSDFSQCFSDLFARVTKSGDLLPKTQPFRRR